MNATSINRRRLLGSVVLAPIAAAACLAPATAFVATPFRIAEARYRAAESRFNNLPENLELDHPDAYRREETLFLAAFDGVTDAAPADWAEYAAAVALLTDGGTSLAGDDLQMTLFGHALRLGREAQA